MRIVHASAEVVPFAKTGGLADVVGALPRAQARAGHRVWVVMPWYANLGGDLQPTWTGDVEVPYAGATVIVGVGHLELAGVHYAFVGHDDFRRPQIYGYEDDVRRFCLFSRAVPVAAEHLGAMAEVVHLHDWHSAALAPLLRSGGLLPPGYAGLPTVLTVHNAQYQGWDDPLAIAHWARLPAESVTHLRHQGHGNLLHAGLACASEVTTVSPSYAEELRQGGAHGLEAGFTALGPRLSGVLNGLDEAAFDPSNDPAILRPYSAADASGKAACKAELCADLGLADGAPLLGLVSRLAEQKGVDLLLQALPQVLQQGWNLVLLGSGDAGLEADVTEAFRRYPGRVAGRIGYDDALARRIYAASDALAIPSRFEPCGLVQMIGMRYGALPVATATGGLIDTISDGEDGFLFAEAETPMLVEALTRARETYRAAGRWSAMVEAAMRRRFAWSQAVSAYDDIYQRIRSGGTP